MSDALRRVKAWTDGGGYGGSWERLQRDVAALVALAESAAELRRLDWEKMANVLADALEWQISRGMTMHYDDETDANEPAECVGCRADDVLTVMGRFPDLSTRARAAAERRLRKPLRKAGRKTKRNANDRRRSH